MKKLFIIALIILPLTGCITNPFIKEPVKTSPQTEQGNSVRYSNKNYKPPYKRTVKKRRTFNSTRKPGSAPTADQKKLFADLRGVVSEDVYDQLEETQAANPIKGYNNINKGSLKKATASKKPQYQPKSIKVEPTLEKPVTLSKKGLIGLSEDIILKSLKKPTDIYNSQRMSLWEYKNNTCTAKLYFYGGSCAFIETEFSLKNYNDTNACLKTFGL